MSSFKLLDFLEHLQDTYNLHIKGIFHALIYDVQVLNRGLTAQT